MKRRRSRARTGRVSVETLVGVSIAAIAIVFLGLTFIAHGEREEYVGQSETASSTAVAHPHEALPFSSSSSPENQGDPTEFTYNGITVLTPPLLVPVVYLADDGRTESAASDDNSSDRKQFGIRKHRRHVAAAHRRGRAEYRIVGLAANRRRIAVRQ